jgi:uncharacterized protein YwbE
VFNQTEVPAHITGSISVTRNSAAHPHGVTVRVTMNSIFKF